MRFQLLYDDIYDTSCSSKICPSMCLKPIKLTTWGWFYHPNMKLLDLPSGKHTKTIENGH